MGLGADLHQLEDSVNRYEAMLGQWQKELPSYENKLKSLQQDNSWSGIAADTALTLVLPGGMPKLHELISNAEDLLGRWRGVLDTISDLIGVISTLVDAVSDAWDWTKGAVSDAWDWTKGAVSDVGNAIGSAASAVGDFFSSW